MKRILALAMIAACDRTVEPQGNVLLYVDTDAPVALFDSLIVDVYPPNATVPCLHCTRRFALGEDLLRSVERPDGLGASIVIPIPPDTGGWRVRARMFTSTATLSGEPAEPRGDRPPQSVVEVNAALPAIAAVGTVPRTIVLHVDDVGAPRGSLDAPVATDAGRPAHSLVGSWPGARKVDCTEKAKIDEVCIPGGAYWMGNPRTISEHLETDVRRLVVVSPFIMQRTEVTVGQYRASGFTQMPKPWSGGTSGNASDDYCTWTASPGPNEELPVNCIRRQVARSYCQALGGDLPTDAQFEHASSGLDGKLFVWGDEHQPTCDDALWGAGGFGPLDPFEAPCKPDMPRDGIQPPGSKTLDRLRIGKIEVVDLAGSMAEWTIDRWDVQDGPCWNSPGPFVDPLCSEGSYDSARGGYWYDGAGQLAAANRRAYGTNKDDVGLGFRCARAGQ